MLSFCFFFSRCLFFLHPSPPPSFPFFFSLWPFFSFNQNPRRTRSNNDPFVNICHFISDSQEVLDIQCSRWFWCCCLCCSSKQNGLVFYTEEVKKYEREYQTQKQRSLKSPLGIAFVTFKTLAMSNEVIQAHKSSVFQKRSVPKSTLSDTIHPENWR